MPRPAVAALTSIAPRRGAAERRGTGRVITILRVAKLICLDGEELCMVRNIASGGAKLRVYSDRRVGERIVLELRSGQSVPGEIKWVRDDSVGVAFDGPIDAEAVLSTTPAIDRQPSRPPRLATHAVGRLTIGGMALSVAIVDLSQGGAKLHLDTPLPDGAEGMLEIASLGKKMVELRWQRAGAAGFAFVAPLSLTELTAWTSARRAELPETSRR